MNEPADKINVPLEVALYARVSTGRQENEQTIESQLEEVKRKIKEDGNNLLPQNVFIDDGWSGEMIVRPGLDKMRDAAREGDFEVLYVYDRGRLSRTFAHQELILEELGDRDIKFLSLHDVQADTPEAKVLQSMQGVFHEYERIKIAERMRRGKLYKAKNGVIINGQPLYGYEYVITQGEPKRCVINEDEARVVRMIWTWFGEDRLSINQIKKKLYELGIKPRKRKSDHWTRGPIIRILKNETYVTGKAYYNKSESVVSKNPRNKTKYKKTKKGSRRMRKREDWIPFEVPKLVTDYSLYEKILKRIEYNRRYAHNRKRRKYDYLLTGLLYCGCGSRRSGDGSSQHGHFYYRCSERIKSHPYPSRCKSGGVNAAVLDSVLWHELKKRLFSYSILKKYAAKWLKSLSFISSESLVEKKRLIAQIEKVKEEQNRYSRAYGTNTLEFEQYQKLMDDAKKRINSYKKQLDDLADRSVKVNITIDVDELVEEAMKIVKSLDFSDKFKVIRDIIDKIVVSERSGAEVWAHLPLPASITEKLGYEFEGRYSRASQRRQEYII